MSSRHLLLCVIASTGLIAIGCQQKQQQAPPQSTSLAPVAAKPATTQPAAQSSEQDERPIITDAGGTADAVTQRASVYAKQMETLLAQRGSAADRPNPTTRPAQEMETHDPAAHPPAHQIASAVPNSGLAVSPGASPAMASPIGAAREKISPTLSEAPAPLLKAPPAKQAAAVIPAGPSSDELMQRLAQHVKDYPQDLGGQFDFQLMQFLRGESVPDMQKLAGLGNEDRELLSALLDGLTNFRTAARADNNMLLSRKVRPILEAADRLRMQAELTIPTVALCSRVTAYGYYDPFDPARFAAGAEHEVVVYCEVENFSSQLDSQRLWETSLREEIVLYSDQGMQVWTPDRVAPKPTIDRSRARRHDFFLGRLIRLPANLSIGRYILKVSVVDQQVNRVAENSVPLEIVAQ
jgi:hypothetical protein